MRSHTGGRAELRCAAGEMSHGAQRPRALFYENQRVAPVVVHAFAVEVARPRIEDNTLTARNQVTA